MVERGGFDWRIRHEQASLDVSLEYALEAGSASHVESRTRSGKIDENED